MQHLPLHKVGFRLVGLALLALAACTTTDEGGAGPRLEHSYGSVVHGELGRVWAIAQATVSQVANNVQVDNGDRRVQGQWNEANVSVQVQRKAPMETILRVSAQQDGEERPDIAERLQIAIQQALLR